MAEAAADKDKPEVPEELQGMESEAKLLAGFLEIPSISKAWLLSAGSTGTTLTVSLSCHSLYGIFIKFQCIMQAIVIALSHKKGRHGSHQLVEAAIQMFAHLERRCSTHSATWQPMLSASS